MNKTYPFLLVILSLLLISGCSFQTSGTPEPSVVEQPSATPEPTRTPLPTPTATPTPLPVTRIQNGELALLAGNYSKAADDFNIVISASEELNLVAAARVNLAYIQILDENCSTALPLLQEIAVDETLEAGIRAKAYYYSALCHQSAFQYDAAARAYIAYAETYPGVLDSFMYEKAGDAFLSGNDFDNALINFTKAVETGTAESSESAKIKIGKIYAGQSDYTNAIRVYMEVHDLSPNEYTRAQMNLLAGQAYLLLGLPEQAYARFQESVMNYPRSYDTYSGLVELVNNGIPVDEFNRGLVDYFAGRYGLAIDAFNRYLNANPEHNGSAHYFKAFAYRAIDQVDNAIQEWRTLINDHPSDQFYLDAWEDIAYTQWAFQNDYPGGAATLLAYVSANPSSNDAPQALYDAGRIYERGGYLTEAAATWSRSIDEYPHAQVSSQSLYLSGITYYRLENYTRALEQFQRLLLLGGSPTETASAQLWIGKTNQMLGKADEARSAWQLAANADPTGFYSLRAQDLLRNRAPYDTISTINLDTDREQERIIAELWMQRNFSLPADTDFTTLNEFYANQNFTQAVALWDLGLYEQARNKFELLREENWQNPLNLFRLAHYFVDIGLYRSALLCSRQILTLANMDDLDTIEAPLWFNHIRFGNYFTDIVTENAQRYGFDPILILSLIRQESFYEGFITSSVGARGMMQIMPATGGEIHEFIRWPENYTEDDLYIPAINIRFGVSYLDRMRNYFNGDLFAALAAYNAGPGNVANWESMARNDPDLFLEIVPFEETRRYIMQIYEFYHLYERFYTVIPDIE